MTTKAIHRTIARPSDKAADLRCPVLNVAGTKAPRAGQMSAAIALTPYTYSDTNGHEAWLALSKTQPCLNRSLALLSRRKFDRLQPDHQAARLLPAAIFFFSISQTVRTSDVISEQSSICRK